jgi:hypothetical protein
MFPHELNEGESVTFRLPLEMVTRSDVIALVITDSHGKEWRAPRKMFRSTRTLALPQPPTAPLVVDSRPR